jgi:hypothetical protein
MTRISVKAEFQPSTPPEKAIGLARLKIQDSWIELLRSFLRENRDNYYRITIEPWGKTATERSMSFFHEIRDRICEKIGDTTKEHKEHIKTEIKKNAAIYQDGKLKSMANYTNQDMRTAIEQALFMAEEAEADIRDLIPEWREYAKKEKPETTG